MEGEGDEIKSKQASKRDRTLLWLWIIEWILSFKSYFRSSYGLRREPEGIEHEITPKSSRPSSALQGGLYDHSQEYDHKKSQEYDPYQSAARQMQDLLFGTSSGKINFRNRICCIL